MASTHGASKPPQGSTEKSGSRATIGRIGALLGVPGLAASAFAFSAVGIAAGAALLLAVVLSLVLVAVVLREGATVERTTAERLTTAALLALPGALTVYLCFARGGYFPDGVASVVLLLAAVFLARNALAARPLEGFGAQASIAAGALALLAAWTLLSALWSGSVERAMIEFDRVLLYALALIVFASLPAGLRNLRWMIRGLALGIATVCVMALVTRTLPEVWPVELGLGRNRLSYPLSYWNSLGIIACIGLILCLHVGSSGSEPRLARVLACAACPLLAATLLLTFSRGAIVVTPVGLLAYAVVARPRLLLTGLAASAPAVAVALVLTYRADELASDNPTAAAAIVQGKELAIALALCAVGAAALRALLLVADSRLERFSPSPPLRRSLVALAGGLVVSAALFALVGTGAPDRLRTEFDRFVSGAPTRAAPQLRDRLTDGSSNGRVEHWRVAQRGFEREPVTGQGAGTFELLWARDRPQDTTGPVRDAHSLYAEIAAELGIVGLILVVVPIGAILLVAVLRARGADRATCGAVFAAGLAWAMHAGIDWDWEMGATSLWFFALGGAVLARREASNPGGEATKLIVRAVTGVLVLLAAALAALIGVSQAQIEQSVEAFGRGDCRAAVRSAASATATLDLRVVPTQILGFCYAGRGLEAESVRAMQVAVERDPHNSQAYYGLAVVRAAAGLDPRRAAREAVRLDPGDPLARDTARLFDTESPSKWKRGAMLAPLFLSREGPFIDFTELRTG